MSKFLRWLTAIIALVLMALATGGAWFFHVQEQHLRADVESNLEAMARLKADQIGQWRFERLGDGAVLMENPFTHEALTDWMVNSHINATEPILTLFHSLQKRYHYSDVLLVDAHGQLRFSLTGRTTPIHEETQKCLAKAFRQRRPVLTDLHASDDELPPRLSVVVPFFATNGETAEPIGAVLLQSDARTFLYPLIQSWPTPSRSAETLLVRREGDAVLLLNDMRYQPDTAFKRRIPLSSQNVPSVMTRLGKDGVVEGRDYRGAPVLAVSKAIPDTNWLIVAKIDKSEALAEWRFRSILILILMLGAVAAATTTAGMLWQYYAKAHYRTLFEKEATLRASEELSYRTTLMSIGDGVIVTDARARVRLINPVAETLTGWAQAEARGKPVNEVFRIVNQETRQPVENPVARVLEEGARIGLANRTLLISRSGRQFPIAESGAPIFDETGKISGVVLVFRDITESKRTESLVHVRVHLLEYAVSHSLEQLLQKTLDEIGALTNSPIGFYHFIENDQETISLQAWSTRTLDEFCKAEGKGRHHPISKAGVWADCVHAKQPVIHNDYATLTHRKGLPEGHATVIRELVVPIMRSDCVVAVLGIGNKPTDYTPEDVELVSYLADLAWEITLRKRSEEEKEKLGAQLRQAQKMEAVGRLAGGVAHDFNNMLSVILGYTELILKELKPLDPIHEPLKAVQSAARRSAELTRQLLAFSRKQAIAPRVLDLNEQTKTMERLLSRIIGEDIDLAFNLATRLWPVYMDPAQIDQTLANLVVNSRDAMPKGGRLAVETANITLNADDCKRYSWLTPGDFVMLAVGDTGCGMDRETLEHVFEPFFTTKPEGKGTGLGLATVYGIVKQNNSFVNIYSEPGQGTTVKIYIPRYVGPEVAAPVAAEQVKPTGGWETILLVEDESQIRQLAKIMLEQLGYRVLEAPGPGEAMVLCEKHSGDIHLLLTDVVMPNMDGKELERRIKAMKPGVRTLFMSGYTADGIAHMGVLEKGVHFLHKPFSLLALARKVRQALT